jgi:hypothetical protein
MASLPAHRIIRRLCHVREPHAVPRRDMPWSDIRTPISFAPATIVARIGGRVDVPRWCVVVARIAYNVCSELTIYKALDRRTFFKSSKIIYLQAVSVERMVREEESPTRGVPLCMKNVSPSVHPRLFQASHCPVPATSFHICQRIA